MTLLKPEIPRVDQYRGDRTTMPDWVREGDNVAVITGGRHGYPDHVAFRPVKRVTAKFVVVDGPNESEQRFSLTKGLELTGERGSFTPKTFLADPNSAAVKFARAESRMTNLAYAAHQKANAFARKPSPEAAQEAEEAFRAYRVTLEHLMANQDAYLAEQAERKKA